MTEQPNINQMTQGELCGFVYDDEISFEAFQSELNKRWPVFNIADHETWPCADGLYLCIRQATGRIEATVLPWTVGMEPREPWQAVERYVAIEDIMPRGSL